MQHNVVLEIHVRSRFVVLSRTADGVLVERYRVLTGHIDVVIRWRVVQLGLRHQHVVLSRSALLNRTVANTAQVGRSKVQVVGDSIVQSWRLPQLLRPQGNGICLLLRLAINHGQHALLLRHRLVLILLVPGFRLVACHSIQCELVALRESASRKQHLVLLGHTLRLIFYVEHLGVLKLLRAEEPFFVLCATVLLIVQVRANHP